MNWVERDRSKDEMEAETTEEYHRQHSLRWRLSWRGKRFLALEKKMVIQVLAESGITELTRRRIKRFLYTREEKTTAYYHLKDQYRRISEEFTRVQERALMATREYKTAMVDKEVAQKNLYETNHWKWLIDAVVDLPQGQVFCVTVPPDADAGRLANMIRSVFSMNKATRMTRWSVKRSHDAKELYICKIGEWAGSLTIGSPQAPLTVTHQ